MKSSNNRRKTHSSLGNNFANFMKSSSNPGNTSKNANKIPSNEEFIQNCLFELNKNFEEMKFELVNISDNNGTTKLMDYCREGHLDIVKLLIARGADIHIQNHEGETSLMFACREGPPTRRGNSVEGQNNNKLL